MKFLCYNIDSLYEFYIIAFILINNNIIKQFSFLQLSNYNDST